MILLLVAWIIRAVIVCCAPYLRFRRLTSQSTFIFICVFTTYFLAYTISPLFSSMDIRERSWSDTPFLADTLFRNGIFTDFNASWFWTIGYTVGWSMVLFVFMPILEFAMSLGYY